MNVKIQDLKDVTINGVKTLCTKSPGSYKETFFEWTAFPMAVDFKSTRIACGLLEGWHHTPTFNEIEYHEDAELFYFLEGPALMLFVDIKAGKAVMESAQIVRIPAGTELSIDPGKGHFVAVAEGDTMKALVVAPVQDSPRITLDETVCGE